MTPTEILYHHGVHDSICGGGWLRLKPGQVTDDTTMSLALGKAILGNTELKAEHIAELFSVWMSCKPVDIGNTVRRGIVHYRYSGDPCVKESEHDAGNGACMRSLPMILATLDLEENEVRRYSKLQAHITHNNVLSDAGTECITIMVQQALAGMNKKELLFGPVSELISQYPEFSFQNKRRENPTGYIIETLQAVFQAFFDTTSFETCLVDVVNRGGDADTTGAIAGMLAGALYGPDAIPARWLHALDNNIRKECETQSGLLPGILKSSAYSNSQSAGGHVR
jgi:ADP-ribosyl-[dinitrogen reductase] hydrolase